MEGLIVQRKQHLQHLDDLLKSIFLEMFGDPNGWPSMPLSSIAADGKGTFSNGPFGSNLLTSELTDTGFPVIYIRDIRNARYERVSTVCVTEEKTQEIDTCLVQPGDILVAKVGDPPGTAAIYPTGEPIGVITQDVIRLRPNTEIVNAEFVALFLNSHIGCRLIREITVEATRARFGLREFKMQEIPVPPMNLQMQFATIVEKVEGIKSCYQQGLTDLETLYGALSQKAFKGELDLSRVPLPPDDPEAIAADPLATHELPHTADTFHLPAPSDLATLNSPEGRTALLDNWLTLWLERLNNTPFSTQPFIDAAQQRLWELAEQDGELAEDDTLELGAADYDYVRLWISESLERRHLAQTYNDDKNRVQLKAVSHR